MNDEIKDVYERCFNLKITNQDKNRFHTQFAALVITCFWDGVKARTRNILNMTNLQYGNNQEAKLTVMFATQMIVLAAIEGHGSIFSMLKIRL